MAPSLFRKGGSRGDTKTVRITFVVSDFDGVRAITREQSADVDLRHTTYGRLKEMASFLLNLGAPPTCLWLIGRDGCPSPMSHLKATDPISRVIAQEAKIQVETAAPLVPATPEPYAPSSWTIPDDIPIAMPIASSNERNGSQFMDNTSSDEQVARALAEELNGGEAPAPTRSQPSVVGSFVAQASCSQFSVEGGRSACTAICLYGAAQLLPTIVDAPASVIPDVLDQIVGMGVVLYQNVPLQQDHSSVDDLWNAGNFPEVVGSLRRCPDPITGETTWNSFQLGLHSAVTFARSQNKQSVAVIVTKPPETVLVLCKDVQRLGPWFFFDSHGQDHEREKRAYVKQLDSLEGAVSALLDKFPTVLGLGDSLFEQQLKMFEAHAIVYEVTLAESEITEYETEIAPTGDCGVEAATVPGAISVQNDSSSTLAYKQPHGKMDGDTDRSPPRHPMRNASASVSIPPPPPRKPPTAQSQTPESPREQPPPPPPPPQQQIPPPPPRPTPAPAPAPPRPQQPNAFSDTDLFRDPLSGELFADPVFCDHGCTHERSFIERHFQSRREMKAEEERKRQAEGRPPPSDCGRGSNFDPTCPLTGEPISEILIENLQFERVVVTLVESGTIQLDEEELEEWKARREEKAKQSAERRAKERIERARQEALAAAEEAAAATAPPIDSGTVMIHRQFRIAASSEQVDLGLSVGLYVHWRSSGIPNTADRCFNACCRTRLVPGGAASTMPTRCARCGQGYCGPCLRFQVTEATHDSDIPNQQLHAICPECVWQIIDVLATTQGAAQATLVNNLDSVVSRYFQGHVMAQASQLQQQIVRHEKHQEFVQVETRLQSELQTLRQSQETLEEQIRQAEENAERARRDEGSTVPTSTTTNPNAARIRELETKISELQAKYDAFDLTSLDEETVMEMSPVLYELNEAQTELALLSSMTSSSDRTSGKELQVMEELSKIQIEHDEFESKGPTEGEEMEYAMRMSELQSRYDSLIEELTKLQAEAEVPQPAAPQHESVRTDRIKSSLAGFVGGALLFPARVVGRALTGNSNRSSRSIPGSPPSSNSSSSHSRGKNRSSTRVIDSPQASTTNQNTNLKQAPTIDAETLAELKASLGAIVENQSPTAAAVELPWDLSYPSVRMHSQVLLMKNELDRQKLELERDLDRENAQRQAELEAERDELEDEIGQMRRAAEDAEAVAAQEERRRQERARRRYEAEQERLRKERERAAEEARIRAEKERLERDRQKQERETRQALQGIDLRQCGRCGFGPFERYNCPDMAAHNDPIYVLDKRGRRVKRGRNECPECGWTNKNWNNWPKFRP